MTNQPNEKVETMMSDLEGRLTGVFTRFFKGQKLTIEEVGKELSHDPELVELSVATNALLFQLASLIVMLHRKTGGDIENLVRVETSILKYIVPACKDVRDSIDAPALNSAGVH